MQYHTWKSTFFFETLTSWLATTGCGGGTSSIKFQSSLQQGFQGRTQPNLPCAHFKETKQFHHTHPQSSWLALPVQTGSHWFMMPLKWLLEELQKIRKVAGNLINGKAEFNLKHCTKVTVTFSRPCKCKPPREWELFFHTVRWTAHIKTKKNKTKRTQRQKRNTLYRERTCFLCELLWMHTAVNLRSVHANSPHPRFGWISVYSIVYIYAMQAGAT